MKIQLSKIQISDKELFDNYSCRYLTPILGQYSIEFSLLFQKVFKVAIGIGDFIVDRCGLKCENHIFLLINAKLRPEPFNRFLEYVKDQDYYEDDYAFDIVNGEHLHVVIIKVPEKFNEALKYFKVGKYSKMYPKEEVGKLFGFINSPNNYKVVVRDPSIEKNFIKAVNKKYNTEITDFSIPDYELDFPPDLNQEKF